MGRQHKTGLDYFPVDVDIFDDPKLEFVAARFGSIGEIVSIKLLCRIYRNGYYYKWNEDEALLFAKRVGGGCQHSLVNDVVHELVKRDFFDKSIFDSFQILTSRGIQRRYFEAVLRRKDPAIDPRISLVSVNGIINREDADIIPINGIRSTQRKEKESRGKNRKEESASENAKDVSEEIFLEPPQQDVEPPEVLEKPAGLVFPWESEGFALAWANWKAYRKEQHSFQYKGLHSEQAALMELSNMAGGQETEALAILLYTTGRGWKGFVKPKNNDDGKQFSNGHSHAKPGGLNADHKRDMFERAQQLTRQSG